MIKKRWLIPGLGVLLLVLGVGGWCLWSRLSAPLLPFKIKCPVSKEYCQEAFFLHSAGEAVGLVVPERTAITIPFDGFIAVTKFPEVDLIYVRLGSGSDSTETVTLDFRFRGELEHPGIGGPVKEGWILGYAGETFDDTEYVDYSGANLLLKVFWQGRLVGDFREYLD